MNLATQRLDRFAAYVSEAQLGEVPRTAVLYCGDNPARTTEIAFDPEVFGILNRAEQTTYGVATLREAIGRTHATACLMAYCAPLGTALREFMARNADLSRVTAPEVLILNYESATVGVLRVYPVTRDAGAIRPGVPVNFRNPKRWFANDFLA